MYRLTRLRLPLLIVLPLWLLTLGGAAFGGYVLAPRRGEPCPQPEAVCEEFAVFWQAWDIASERFVDPEAIDPKQMTEGAVQGMLDSLGDRGHTRFLSAETAERWRESLSGRFEGVGATLDIREQGPLIVSTIEGAPAERAGVRAGDLLLKIDGASTEGLTIEDVVSKVRGPAGTQVTLTVLHEGDQVPVDITITRAEVQVPNVSWRMLPNNIALIHLAQFAEDSAGATEQALRAAQEQGARAIIFDLRDNPGGLVHEAVAVASAFLPPNTTVFQQENREGERQPYTTGGDPVAPNIPLVVLINQNSASSAEIVSGAIQDHDRAQLIGVPTAGTGTVLNTFDLEDGAQLLLGTQEWLTPNGELIKGQGIMPDEVVQLAPGDVRLTPSEAAELSREQLQSSVDIQLARAIELLESQASR